MKDSDEYCQLQLGWAEGNITPSQPVLIAGQFHARVSEGVLDPITTTVLAMEADGEQAVFVSCDLVSIGDDLRDAVRARLEGRTPGLDPRKVVLHGTHTHTAPENRLPEAGSGHTSGGTGVDLPVMPIEDYVDFAADRIADTVRKAWDSRSTAGVAFGQGFAVVGRNRRWTDKEGVSTMYGNTDTPEFSHIEGYEDHSVNLLATYDAQGALTGLVVNVPCPSQVSESAFSISADYWHETRQELRRQLGDSIHILAQCSAAGDQSPHLLFEKRAAARMLELSCRTERQEIAHRIANAVEETLPHIRRAIDSSPILKHHVEMLDLPLAQLTEADAGMAAKEAECLSVQYQQELQKLEGNPALRKDARWYCTVTAAYRRMRWFEGVVERFQQQKTQPTRAAEVHVIRLSDVAFATNPFEYYLDYGIHIKARSRAVQTFLVQLAGQGTYVPSVRSMTGGGYGSIPASNPVDCEGGWQLAERTAAVIEQLWDDERTNTIPYDVQIRQVTQHHLAVVRTRATMKDLGEKIREILTESAVYNFLENAGFGKPGYNIIVYWDEEDKALLRTDEGLTIEVGVQVASPFEGDGYVTCSATPGGTAATAVHMGSYDKLSEVHAAIREWCQKNNRQIAGPNWEVYGHWNDDPGKLRTDVFYLLK